MSSSSEFFEWVVIVLLVCMSALFSGLTLGLLGMDTSGLKIVMTSGTPKEREFARRIYPLRVKGNLLLCTLLLGNVAVNALLSILLAEKTSGTTGFFLSTASIVVFGEILPQATCSRYALAIGARTTWIVYVFLVLLFPISYPISRVLDLVLGRELGTIYSKQELATLVHMHVASAASGAGGASDGGESGGVLSQDEALILRSALSFSTKQVHDIMTRLEDVFMVGVDASLDVDQLNRIVSSGYSRVPVYDGARGNIVGVLIVKDLALLDPDDATSVRVVIDLFQRRVPRLYARATLDETLAHFRQWRSHLAVVYDVNRDGPGDPFQETVGICTMEDVIEELIGLEIEDETDAAALVAADGGEPLGGVAGLASDASTLAMTAAEAAAAADACESLASPRSEDTSDNPLLESRRRVAAAAAASVEQEAAAAVRSRALLSLGVDHRAKRWHSAVDTPAANESDVAAALRLAASSARAPNDASARHALPKATSSPSSSSSSPLHNRVRAGDALGVDQVAGIVGFLSRNSLFCDSVLAEDTLQKLVENAELLVIRPGTLLYERGTASHAAALVLSGRLEVRSGQEGFVSHTGLFSLIGTGVLSSYSARFVPDFTARAVGHDNTQLLVISRHLYKSAQRATRLKRRAEKKKKKAVGEGEETEEEAEEEEQAEEHEAAAVVAEEEEGEQRTAKKTKKKKGKKKE